jgi:hypothetical protein
MKTTKRLLGMIAAIVAFLLSWFAQGQQILNSNIDVTWNGQPDGGSSWDVLVTAPMDGNMLCSYSIGADLESGQNSDAAIFVYNRGFVGQSSPPDTEIFSVEVVEGHSLSGGAYIAVSSNYVYELEAWVYPYDLGNASATFSIPISVVAPPPTLGYTTSGNTMQLYWPTNFNMQTTATLTVSNTWSDFLAVPAVSNNQNVITVDITNGNLFFRLIQK